MDSEQGEGLVKKLHVPGLMDPAARAAGMWQRNDDAGAAFELHLMLAADDIAQCLDADKPLDRQSTNRNDQPGTNDPQLLIQPITAPRTLSRRRHAVSSAARMWTGIAAGDGGYIEEATCAVFIEAGELKPLEQCDSSATSEWTSAAALGLSRRLTHEHRTRSTRKRNDRHYVGRVGTPSTGGESRPMRIEGAGELARAGCGGHLVHYTAPRGACRSALNRYSGRTTPRSVMIAEMRAAGVTSKAGL